MVLNTHPAGKNMLKIMRKDVSLQSGTKAYQTNDNDYDVEIVLSQKFCIFNLFSGFVLILCENMLKI